MKEKESANEGEVLNSQENVTEDAESTELSEEQVETMKVEFTPTYYKIPDYEEQQEIKLKRRKQIKKVAKIAAVVIIGLIVVFVALCCIIVATTPNLNEDESAKKYSLVGIEYEMPISWEQDNLLSTDYYSRFKKSEDGEVIAIVDVEYKGENDLETGDAAYEDEHTANPGIEEVLPQCKGSYQEVVAGTSVFEVTVYRVEGEVTGEVDFLSKVIDSFDISNYDNPRKSKGIVVEYTGSTKAGVTIDAECDDISATETFDTVLGEGTKELDWTIERPVTLKAGKRSSVTVDTESGSETIKVECTTLSEAQYKEKCVSRNYKNQLRKASYGEYIKIYGKVLQDCGSGYFRISSSGGYDNVYMVYAPGSDIVEDDWATIYGLTSGIYTYETVMGATKKIPAIAAEYVER